MRVVVQRVSEASVEADGRIVSSIGRGMLVLLGINKTDSEKDADYLADKLAGLRIFADEAGKMNRNVLEAGGGMLVVSQVTLYADCRRGRRPSLDRAAGADRARALYEYFVQACRRRSVPAATGVFQAMMNVRLTNEGPVTIICDSDENSSE